MISRRRRVVAQDDQGFFEQVLQDARPTRRRRARLQNARWRRMLESGKLQEVAMLFTYVNEDEDNDPVGPRDALELFKAAAVEAGLIRPGDPLDQNVVDFARLVVQMCASIGDNYVQPESAEGATVGDRIRGDLQTL